MSLDVERIGDCGGELVLLHGWGMNPGVWAGLPVAFAAGCRQHRIGLPGHGGSPLGFLAGERADVAAWADACLAVAPQRAVWIGWSLGGLIALAAATRAPARIAGLILVTASPRFTCADDWRHAMPVGTLDQFQSNLLSDPAATLERFIALQVRASDGALATLRRLRSAIGRHPPPEPEALRLGLRLLREVDLRAQLGRLACPTLWLFGARDTLVPAGLGADVAGLSPSARVQVIDGAGHAPFISHPDEATAAMGAFLSEALR